MTVKLCFQYTLSSVWVLLWAAPLAAQQPSWKSMRQHGVNFYEIQDSFEQQNAALIQAFQAAPFQHEGDSAGKFNSIIKFNRWAHRVKARSAESQGDLSAITAGNARALAQRANETQSRTGESWRAISPPVTPMDGGNGRINAVRVHPTNPNTLFACSPAGGLWKSLDGGDAWVATSENIAILGCSDVAFSAADPNTMYLATGDGDASDSYSTGVYKSTDGGATWNITGLAFTAGQQAILSRILVNPIDESILVSGSKGIYRSTNGGTSWTNVSLLSTRDMAFKTDNPNIVFATKYDAATSCLLRSADGGATWTTISTGLPTSGTIRAAIGVTPADANYVYLMVSDNVDHGLKGIYRSIDGGLTFTNRNATPTNTMGWEVSGNDSGGQGWYDIAIAVSPTNRDLLVTGGVNIWKSTNGGASFTISAHWYGANGVPYVHADVHNLVFKGNTLWAGCDGGVFKTTNNGSTWIDKSSNLSIAQMYGMGLSATNPNLIVSGHQDNGTNLMTSPTQWEEVLGGDGMQCFIDRTNNNNIFGSIYTGRIYRSTNGGNSFDPLSPIPNGNWVTPWLQDPVIANTLYAGGKEVFKSTDLGTTWLQVSNFGGAIAPVAAIDVARPNHQIVFAVKGNYVTSRRVYTPQVFKSTNGGDTWTEVTSANFPANASIIGLHIDVNNSNRIYLGFASYVGSSVFVSNNGGTTWTNFSTGLPQVPANCFITTLGNANGEVFVGTDIGVYHRTNSLNAWEPFSNNLPSAPVSDLEIFYPTAQLRIATFGRGVWETTLPGYNTSPIVQLTNPNQGHVFNSPATISLAATASDPDGRVTRVDFYRDSTLIGTDTSAPYTYAWTNALTGNYQLTAKAVDDSSAVSVSTPINIWVLGAVDAQIAGIVTPTSTVATDSSMVVIRLKNAGANALTSADIYYQLDNQTLRTYHWTGNLSSLSETNVPLPNGLRYAIGQHQLWVYTTNPNNMNDENRLNDSLRYSFEYQAFGGCSNSYEPNNEFATATLIPTNTTIRSKLATSGDVDYFQFKTIGTQTAFKVILNELLTDFDLAIYKYDFVNNVPTLLGVSQLSGSTPDSVALLHLVDTGTYFAKVHYGNDPTNCYALKVTTFDPIRYDMAIDSIFTPRGNVLTNTIMPRIRIKNRGNTPVLFVEIGTQLDNNSGFNRNFYPLSRVLEAGDTISINLTTLVANYAVGEHLFTVNLFPPPNLDSNPANDTATATFRYVLAPLVALSQPLNDQIFAPNSAIPLAATAIPQNGGTISKVVFYNGNTLLATDVTSPYSFTLNNAPIGTYRFTAKAFDNANDSTTSEVSTVFVTGANDAGVYGLTNETDFIGYDSTRPIAQVRNYGSSTLTHVQVYYQLDNQPIINQAFTSLNMIAGQRTTFTLPTLRYPLGMHDLKVWTAQPNGVADLNTGNDTFRFHFEYLGFGACADNYEPNNTLNVPTLIPTNVTVRSKLATSGDEDWFTFKTTLQQPNFTVILDELVADHDVTVMKWNYALQSPEYIGSSSRSGTTTDSVRYQTGIDTGTYLVRVYYGGGDNACYALTVRTYQPILTDIGVDTIFVPNGLVLATSFTPIVRIRNYGQEPISGCSIYYQLDNGFFGNTFRTFSTPLRPNDTISIALPPQTWYSTGAHTFTAFTNYPNFTTDVNARNDTARSYFTHAIPPRISLLTPFSNQIFASNATIALSADAVGNGATITRVEFYNGNTLLGSDNTSPYTYNWTNVPIGTYQIWAKAVDTINITASTMPIPVYVSGNLDAGVNRLLNLGTYVWADSLSPQVRIRNYGTQSLTSVTVNYRLNQNAVVSRALTGLNLATGDSMLVSMPTMRYNTGFHTFGTWTSLPNGNADPNPTNDTLKQAFEYRDFSTCGDYFEPNNRFETCTPIPTDVTIRSQIGSFEDVDGFIFKTTADKPHFTVLLNELTLNRDMELYRYNSINGDFSYVGSSWQSGTNPDSIIFTSNLDTGTYVIAIGNGVESSSCYALRVNTYAPAVLDIGVDSIFMPTPNITTSTFTPTIRIRNYGNVPVTQFQVSSYVDNNGSVSQNIALQTPLQANQTTIIGLIPVTNYTTGNHQFTVVTSYPNNSWDMRQQNDGDTVHFRYAIPPTVSIVSPINGQSFAHNTPIHLTANAAAANGLNLLKVDFYDGTTLLNSDYVAPYSYIWAVSAGNHLLTAVATDELGVAATSNPVAISTNNAPPSVTLVSPTNGQTFVNQSNITLEAIASDPEGQLAKVEFYRGATLLGTDYTAPYSYVWMNTPNGNYALTAKAYDSLNSSTLSAVVNIVVSANQLPVVQWTAPTDGSIYIRTSPQGVPLNLIASASDADGSIVHVQFWDGATLLATDSTAPYAYNWANAPLGQHHFTAKARDSQGGEATSTIATILVVNIAPIVSWITPTNNQVFAKNTPITLAASASDSIDGRIVKVDFYRDNLLLGTDSVAPYQTVWQNAPVGMYQLSIKALDDAGAITTDQNRVIEVKARLDASPLSLNRPTNLITVDTANVQMVLKNMGIDTLTSVQIGYQLNNGTPRSQTWTGSLANNKTANVDLPTLNLTNVGIQALKVWTTLPNQGADDHLSNDTLTYNFNYQICGDNYEPNNAPANALQVAFGKYYYAQIAQSTDKDYYKFSTTASRPKVRITVRHATLDAELQLYRVESNGDLSNIALANRRGLGRELLVWNETNLSTNYVVAVTSYNGAFEVDSCYSLLVENADTLMTGVSTLPNPAFQFKIAPNPATDEFRVLVAMEIIQSLENQLIVRDMLGRKVFSRGLQPSDNNTPITVRTEGWSKGMYFVSIQRDGQIVTEKLLIE